MTGIIQSLTSAAIYMRHALQTAGINPDEVEVIVRLRNGTDVRRMNDQICADTDIVQRYDLIAAHQATRGTWPFAGIKVSFEERR